MAYRPLETFEHATLVEAVPSTGFLHQIRVSFAHLGHALLGDSLYGDETGPDDPGRHMLHAARFRLGDIDVESPDPADLVDLLTALRS